MARINHWHEYLLLLANRGAVPGSTFVAMAFFQRAMTHEDFESFLLALSLCQWILAFGFQWQKNAAVRLFHYDRYQRISLIALSAVLAVASLFYILFAYFTNMEVLVGGLIYTLAAGVLYYASTNYRMRGSVSIYANMDTTFQIVRWGVAILAVIFVANADAPFWGAAGAIAVAIALFTWLPRNDTAAHGPTLTWKDYLSTGLWLAMFDFAGAGMMYIDRFYVHDANYILHSTVSSQIGSVLFGALVATAYPRVILAWREGGNTWPREFKRMARFIAPLLALTPILCVTAGPILLSVLSPKSQTDLRLLAILGICQSLHHIIYFTSIVLIIHSKNYLCGALYMWSFVLYSCVLILLQSQDWLLVSGLKCLFLCATLIVVSIPAFMYTRRLRAHVANN